MSQSTELLFALIAALALGGCGASSDPDEPDGGLGGSAGSTQNDGSVPEEDSSKVDAAQPGCDATGKVGDLAVEPTEIELTVNLSDGFSSPATNARYLLRPAGSLGYLFYNDSQAITVDGPQVEALLNKVRNASYHMHCSCMTLAIDGAPYPPSLVVRTVAADWKFTVSDNECGPSDHSRTGNALSCADYQGIEADLAALAGITPHGGCASYW